MSFITTKENQTVAATAPLGNLPNEKSDFQLPENPLVVIEPSKGWVPLNLRDIWQYRDLLYILAMRDIRVRYKQTVLGALWAIMQPLFSDADFHFVFRAAGGNAFGRNSVSAVCLRRASALDVFLERRDRAAATA
jgi:hypothetical protein